VHDVQGFSRAAFIERGVRPSRRPRRAGSCRSNRCCTPRRAHPSGPTRSRSFANAPS